MSINNNLVQGDPLLSYSVSSSNQHNYNLPLNYIHNFKIFHQNIHSMRKNFDFFVIHLESFVCQPDIIFLTEIWIKQNEISNYHIYAELVLIRV